MLNQNVCWLGELKATKVFNRRGMTNLLINGNFDPLIIIPFEKLLAYTSPQISCSVHHFHRALCKKMTANHTLKELKRLFYKYLTVLKDILNTDF